MSAPQTFDVFKNNLEELLYEKCRDGPIYVKSRQVTGDLDASAKKIGEAFFQMERDGADRLTVEKWSYTAATTWKVDRQ